MSYTEVGLRLRAKLRRDLKKAGVTVSRNITTKDMKDVYRKTLKKSPPSYNKMKLWLDSNRVDRRKLKRRL